MAWKILFVDAMDAARNGEAAREAERRAMYARPDALPLPDIEPEAERRGWLTRILGGTRREGVRTGGRSTSRAGSE